MPLPEAMLIDLDDTILSFSTGANACWEAVCREFAPRLNGLTPERLYAAIAETRAWFWGDPERHRINRQNMLRAHRRIVTIALRNLGIDSSDTAARIAETFGRMRRQNIKPFPGAIETLGRLKQRGLRLALVTNGSSEAQREKIDRFNLASWFDAIYIEGECGYGKPDERIYHRALNGLSATVESTWIVGDNLEWEVAVPQKLGFYSIWHDPTGNGLPPDTPVRPDRIIHSLSELLPDVPGGSK